MAGIAFLRRLLMKQAMKKSKDASGIMSLNKNLVNDVDNTVKKWVDSAKSQGQDIDKMGEQEIKYLIELNKPKGPMIGEHRVIDATSPEGKGITESLFGKKPADVLDLSGKKIPPGSQIMGGEEVKIDIVADTIATIKSKKPIDAMAEANSVIGRKGKYKNLTEEQSKKILKDTNDHIFERDIKYDEFGEIIKPDPEDFAGGGRTGYFTGALADTKQGKAMSPGTSADYSPGQGHRATADANKQLTEIIKMHNMKTAPKPPKRSIHEKIGGGINRVLNNPWVRGYAAWGSGGLSEKLRSALIAKQLYNNRNILGDEAVEEEVQNIPTMGGITPAYAQGGRTSTGLNYLLGEDDQNSRVPYAGGGIGRRLFLKLMGGAAAGTAAAKSGLFSLLKGGGKKQIVKDLTSIPIKSGVDGMPVWFKPLVNKVIKEGDDVSKRFATQERQVVHQSTLPDSKTDVIVTQDITSGNVSVDIGMGKHGWADGHFGQPVRLEYRAGEWVESTVKKGETPGKGTKSKEEFWVEEAEFTGGHPENIKFEETSFEKFGSHGSNFDEVEKFATGKVKKVKPTKKKLQTEHESGKWEADYDDSLPDYEDFSSGGRVPLAGGKGVMSLIELIIKKFGKDTAKRASQLGKPQKTLDREMFQNFNKKLNPGKDSKSIIPKDEYREYKNDFNKEILNMSPEDQLRDEFPGISDRLIRQILTDKNPQRIAEVKQTMREALKMQEKGMGHEEIIEMFKKTPRTKNASGGRVPLSGGLAGMLGE